MAIPSCDVHERLCDPRRHAWITWSRLYVEMVQGLWDLLEAEHSACDDDKVTLTFCDRCAHIARQAVDAPMESGDESLSQSVPHGLRACRPPRAPRRPRVPRTRITAGVAQG